MLRGNSLAKVDEKGRLKLPAAFRSVIEPTYGNEFFVTSLRGASARIYPMQVYAELEDKMLAASSVQPRYAHRDVVAVKQRPHLPSGEKDVIGLSVVADYKAESVFVPADDASDEVEFRRQKVFAAAVFEDLARAHHRVQPVDEQRSHALAPEPQRFENGIHLERPARFLEEIDELVRARDRVLVGLALVSIFPVLLFTRQVPVLLAHSCLRGD